PEHHQFAVRTSELLSLFLFLQAQLNSLNQNKAAEHRVSRNPRDGGQSPAWYLKPSGDFQLYFAGVSVLRLNFQTDRNLFHPGFGFRKQTARQGYRKD